MALSVKELTDLSNETVRARARLDQLLDFVDVVSKDAEELEGDINPASEKIKELTEAMRKPVQDISDVIETQLNKIPIDREETKEAATKLMLYHGSAHQVLAWAETQKSNHKEGSYWFRYWVDILENVMQQQAESGKLEKA